MQQQEVQRTWRRHGFVQSPALPYCFDTRGERRLALHESRRSETRSLRERADTLELAFDAKSLRTICESEAQAKLGFGATVAEVLRHRLADMRAATSPKELVAGQPRIGADRQHMIVDLCNGYCIVFKANHPKNPQSETEDVDWERVSRIKILRIERDHA